MQVCTLAEYLVFNKHALNYLGMYWIDPNGGNPTDAFEVECNFDGELCSTCIAVQRQVSGNSLCLGHVCMIGLCC